MISHSHSMSLVVASIVVSIVAAITALAMMNNMRSLPAAKRKALIVMASFVLGGGIWSMHFLAMLALQFPAPIHYDLLQTLGSGLIAVLVVGSALLLLHFRTRTRVILNLAGVSLGVGIMAMHFIGMMGMRGVIPTFDGFAVFASLIVALLMGVAAIRVSYGARSRQNIIKGGIVFGLSIVVVHFTAMIGTHFSVDPNYSQLSVALDQGVLAIAVTVAVFVICGTFLLAASTFVSTGQIGTVERSELSSETDAVRSQGTGFSEELSHRPSDSLEVNSEANGYANREPDLQNNASEGPKEQEDQQPQDSGEPYLEPMAHASPPIRIPFEEHKRIAFLASDEVSVIRADGRYTQIYSQLGVKLCPWSISEAEKRLADVGFFRSHRSYLINIAKVESFEKNREAGVCRFTGFTNLGDVPVSRARVADIIEKLGL